MYKRENTRTIPACPMVINTTYPVDRGRVKGRFVFKDADIVYLLGVCFILGGGGGGASLLANRSGGKCLIFDYIPKNSTFPEIYFLLVPVCAILF